MDTVVLCRLRGNPVEHFARMFSAKPSARIDPTDLLESANAMQDLVDAETIEGHLEGLVVESGIVQFLREGAEEEGSAQGRVLYTTRASVVACAETL